MNNLSLSSPHQEEDFAALYFLCSLPSMNINIYNSLANVLGAPHEVFNSSATVKMLPSAGLKKQFEALKSNWNISSRLSALNKSGIQLISYFDTNYPTRLKQISDPPLGLFVLGSLPSPNEPSVAIIGARNCSSYGASVAKELGDFLGKSGINIISGMARGIDGIAQYSAVMAGGKSTAVLGCGCDICYPKENQNLYDLLPQNGGIISTYPPGAKPLPANFPPRNRIVSGLSDAVIVVEARQKSGTLITVDMALEQGREVYAVPGRVKDSLSDGCNSLIKQGANIYLNPTQFLTELYELTNSADLLTGSSNVPRDDFKNSHPSIALPISDECLPVYKALDSTPLNIEEITRKVPGAHTFLEIQLLLMQLVLDGFAIQCSPGQFMRL